jgi:hypothetical protein
MKIPRFNLLDEMAYYISISFRKKKKKKTPKGVLYCSAGRKQVLLGGMATSM